MIVTIEIMNIATTKTTVTGEPNGVIDTTLLYSAPLKRLFTDRKNLWGTLGLICKDSEGLYYLEESGLDGQSELYRRIHEGSLEHKMACCWLMLHGKMPIQFTAPVPEKKKKGR